MEDYMNHYEQYKSCLVYNFKLGNGGLGDCIKFFMFILESCMKNKIRLYYKINHLIIEKYIRLNYPQMYIEDSAHTIVMPVQYYNIVNYDFSIPIQDVFHFTDEVKQNCLRFPLTNYVSVHLRLGDKYLETDHSFVICKQDSREFTEEKMYAFIEENESIFFCCDNQSYKLKLKKKYPKIIIGNCDIGHSSLFNTSHKQILDSVTELYLLSNSTEIFCGSNSGFSIVASKFKNIPIKKGGLETIK